MDTSEISNLSNSGAMIEPTAELGSLSPITLVFWLIVLVVYLVSLWKIFVKAGKPGWACLIPFYNLYVLLQIIGRPAWWMLLYIIPVVNFVIGIINALDLAKVFGKSTLFGVVGLWLFGFVGYPMLAFGDATYVGSGDTSTPSLPTTPSPSDTPQQPPSQVPSASPTVATAVDSAVSPVAKVDTGLSDTPTNS